MKSIFPAGLTLAQIETGTKGLFADTLALKFDELGPDYIRGSLVVDSRHLRPGGIVNGGVYLALIETVASVGARCAVWGQEKNTLGIQVSANHLGMAVAGDKLSATAKPVHLGRSTQLWSVSIVNQKGKLLSSGTITMMVVDAP